jgi:hypothetical protein
MFIIFKFKFNIARKFKEQYAKLYSSVGNRDATDAKIKDISSKIQSSSTSISEVDKLTGPRLKAAAARLKPGKGDVSNSFTSEVFLHAPDKLFDALAEIMRMWLVHGHISPMILACAFLPLQKGRKDPSKCSSYRAIVGCSLVFKLMEYVVLDIWGWCIPQDSLQFGYRKKLSTQHCTWLLQEVVSHFRRQGSSPILILMDCKQAFDKCNWIILADQLLEHLPAIVVRVMIVSLACQKAWVKWGSTTSEQFELLNGSGQGRCCSPLFWSLYLLPLLARLRDLGYGCHILSLFIGFIIYADDILLLCPNRYAATRMLKACETWSNEYHIEFSTDENPSKSKTKVIIVKHRNGTIISIAPLTLYGKKLPTVKSGDYLVQIITQEGNMEEDVRIRKAIFTKKARETLDDLHFAQPEQKLQAVKKLNCDHYGSNSWNFESTRTLIYFTYWRSLVRVAFNVDRTTHKHIVDNLIADLTSIKTNVFYRYIKFLKSLSISPSHEVRSIYQMMIQVGRSNTDTICTS